MSICITYKQCLHWPWRCWHSEIDLLSWSHCEAIIVIQNIYITLNIYEKYVTVTYRVGGVHEFEILRTCCNRVKIYISWPWRCWHSEIDLSWNYCETISKKYRYQTIKQKEQSKLKIQKTRLSHEIRRHKWQDNMNLYENQRWNQMLRKGKHFLLRMTCYSMYIYIYIW